MNSLRLALRFLRRDWRSGELRLVVLALIVAVAAITTVGFFTERVEKAMILQINEVLAADLVITGSNPIPARFKAQATKLGLNTAKTLSFPSVIVHNNMTQLVHIKAVSIQYPLRGELRTRSAPQAMESPAPSPPQPGELWGEAHLIAALWLVVGDKVFLGERELTLSRVLSRDSASANSLFRLGPEVLISLKDIPSTGLVTPASRVRHRLLIAGPSEDIDSYQAWAKTALSPGYSLELMSNARPELRNTVDRGSHFLSLAALVTVLVAGATVALSTRRFVERQSDTSAIMRCLGASQRLILQVLTIRLLLLCLLSSLTGSAIGLAGQNILTGMISQWFGNNLPAPSPWPLFAGIGTGLVTLIGFTLPSALRLGSVPPLRVLHRNLGITPPSSWLIAASSLAAMTLLIWWQAGDTRLASWVLAGALATVGLLLLVSRLLVNLMASLRHRGGSIWRYGLAGLSRNPGMTTLQLTGFGLGILALLLLTIIRVDLLAAWQQTIPGDAPNHFLINIQPQDVGPLEHFFGQQKIVARGIYPMLRARLTHINERPVSEDDYPSDRAKRLVSREFNLSRATAMQPGNSLVSGAWWSQAQQASPLVSVEAGLAQTLGIQLQDELSFNLAGSLVKARVANLRAVKWDSFQPNFFVIGTPGLLTDYPTNFITSFHLSPGDEVLLARLIERFPAITIIDVSAILRQLREIMIRGSQAVEYVFLFTLAAGLLMLYAGIQANREHRRQESAVLRTLGLQRRGLLAAATVEFLSLGLLAGLLATFCATITGWFVATEVFGLNYQLNLWTSLCGLLISTFGIALAGLAATYPLTIRPPLATLQEH